MVFQNENGVDKQEHHANIVVRSSQDDKFEKALKKDEQDSVNFYKKFASIHNTTSITKSDNGEYFLRKSQKQFDNATNFFYVFFFIILFISIIFWFKALKLGNKYLTQRKEQNETVVVREIHHHHYHKNGSDDT